MPPKKRRQADTKAVVTEAAATKKTANETSLAESLPPLGTYPKRLTAPHHRILTHANNAWMALDFLRIAHWEIYAREAPDALRILNYKSHKLLAVCQWSSCFTEDPGVVMARIAHVLLTEFDATTMHRIEPIIPRGCPRPSTGVHNPPPTDGAIDRGRAFVRLRETTHAHAAATLHRMTGDMSHMTMESAIACMDVKQDDDFAAYWAARLWYALVRGELDAVRFELMEHATQGMWSPYIVAQYAHQVTDGMFGAERPARRRRRSPSTSSSGGTQQLSVEYVN